MTVFAVTSCGEKKGKDKFEERIEKAKESVEDVVDDAKDQTNKQTKQTKSDCPSPVTMYFQGGWSLTSHFPFLDELSQPQCGAGQVLCW